MFTKKSKKENTTIDRVKPRSKFRRELSTNAPLFTMLVPGAVLTIMFAYIPLFGIIIAFKDINMRQGIFGSPWCGFENFEFMFRSNDLWVVLRNTLGYNIFFIVVGTILSMGLAILFNCIQNKRTSKIYQTVLIMPQFLSYVIVACLVMAFLNMENGLLNRKLLPLFGMDTVENPISWYTEPKYWPFILTTVRFWKTVGYGSILYLAAISGVDVSLYEAAEIDGAGTWAKIKSILIPGIKNVIIIKIILDVGSILGGDFGLFMQVPQAQGALFSTTNVLSTYIYYMMTDSGVRGMSTSAAAAFIQSIVGFALVITTNCIVKKIDAEASLF